MTVNNALTRAYNFYKEGKLGDASNICTEILRHNPMEARSLNLLGVIALAQDRRNDAKKFFHFALRVNPALGEACNNLGALLQYAGDNDQASRYYHYAGILKPDVAAYFFNSGLIRLESGDPENAGTHLLRSLELSPAEPGTLKAMARCMLIRAEPEKGLSFIQRAAAADQGDVGIKLDLCQTLAALLRWDEARQVCLRILESEPDFFEALHARGDLSLRLGMPVAAMRDYSRAITLRPGNYAARSNMGAALLAAGETKAASESFTRALSRAPAEKKAGIFSNILLTDNYRNDLSQLEVFAGHRQWAEMFEKPFASGRVRHKNDPNPEKRLKIGYVSADFTCHPVGFFILPVFRAHDRKLFEIHAFSNTARPGAFSREIFSACACAHNLAGMNAQRAAGIVREAEIDILVDLSGHTERNLLPLFALKPAPVQFSWLGYPNTTGLEGMDYRLTDAVSDPETDNPDMFYTEKLIRLKHGFLCFEPPVGSPAPSPSPARKNGFVSFGSFNNAVKISDDTVETWAEILKTLPDSRLVLKSRHFAEDACRDKYLDRFAARGIRTDRITALPRCDLRIDHLRQYHQIDISLDSFPYNGTTTTCEAIFMGTPVIALCGDRHTSRVGAGILTRIGADGLIAGNRDEYVRKAVSLAVSPDDLDAWRGRLRAMLLESPLCDARLITAGIEDAYRRAWRDYCAGSPEV